MTRSSCCWGQCACRAQKEKKKAAGRQGVGSELSAGWAQKWEGGVKEMTVVLRCVRVCVCVVCMNAVYLILNPSSPERPDGLLFTQRNLLFSFWRWSLGDVGAGPPPPCRFYPFKVGPAEVICGFANSQYLITLTISVKSARWLDLWLLKTDVCLRICVCVCVQLISPALWKSQICCRQADILYISTIKNMQIIFWSGEWHRPFVAVTHTAVITAYTDMLREYRCRNSGKKNLFWSAFKSKVWLLFWLCLSRSRRFTRCHRA